MLVLNDGRKKLYQWDTGRIATVSVDCDVVHFSNLNYGESVSVEVAEGKVNIPNKLLTKGSSLYCWAVVEDENGYFTKKEQIIEVVKRPKPSDYAYTETEVISIENAVKNALQKAKESGDFKGDPGEPGDDYVLTEDDKTEIAQESAKYVEIPEQVQADLSQNDENKTDYVKGRTHWSETVYGEVLPLTKFVANGTKNTQLPTTVLELGKTYTVVYDGTPYTCEAKAVESGGVIGVGIGNDVIFGGEQTSEPFGIAYAPYYNYTGVIAFDSDVHSVQITGEKTIYHKIPREYLYSKRIEFTLGGEDAPGYWNAYANADIRDIINDAENGVFQYAAITFPMQMDERTADIHLTMPLASHETFTRDDGITVHKARFECETELDKRYVFVIAIEAWPEVGVIISGLTKKIADSGKVDTAEVGQTIVVKSVDENGKPTEWEAVDKANEVNHGRLLAEVNFTEETTGVTITDINADVIELAVLIEAATSTPPKFTINEHTVNILGGGWAGGSHIFVKIDKGNGVARIKATATNKGRSTYEIPWDKNEIVESIGIGNLGFASGDFVRVYEGLLAPQLKENWAWND
jgi:hypothetical protein